MILRIKKKKEKKISKSTKGKPRKKQKDNNIRLICKNSPWCYNIHMNIWSAGYVTYLAHAAWNTGHTIFSVSS